MNFWDVVREVSAQPVRREATRLFVLALAGDTDLVARARAEVLGPGLTPEQEADAERFLVTASPPYPEAVEKRLRYADLVVSLPGGPGLTEFRPADAIQVLHPDEVRQRVLERKPELRVALGRRLPGFRRLAAEQVVREVSRVNAEFSAVSGVGQAIPYLAPLFPAVVGADLLMLTKNQILMVFRLAAIYGEDLAFTARLREVLSVAAGAFGWRALAREAAGVLPGALGLPLRAGVAYSGTYAVGRAAEMVFDEGRRPTRREMLRIYEEGRHLAAGVVTSLKERAAERFRRQPRALPPGEAAEDPVPIARVVEPEPQARPPE